MSSPLCRYRSRPLPPWSRFILFSVLSFFVGSVASADEPLDPETTLRTIVRANADRDLATMSKYMSHDADAVGYTIDGHKYVGWPALEAEMRNEFDSVVKLELPITYLQFWSKGDIAWFAMELDYIRHIISNNLTQRMVLPLRETGVLE
ncbi:MAG: nuclear transport factor 2 family protein, partial [Nitrospirota bacterium]|nr:nuclear transport factor 2 family protein [Nitrospirota bacterium]